MKNKKAFAAVISFCMVCMPVVHAKEATAQDWANLEQKYYMGERTSRSLPSIDYERSGVLRESQIDPSKFVQAYKINKNLFDMEQMLEFVSAIRAGSSISSMIVPDNFCLSLVSGESDPIPGTAILDIDENGETYSVGQVIVGDQGESFAINLSEKKKQIIQEQGLDIQNANAVFVIFESYLTAILLSDGNKELIVPITPVYKDISSEEVLTVSQLADRMEPTLTREINDINRWLAENLNNNK